MAKPLKSKSAATFWFESLDKLAIREAYVEATVDAYGDYEQHTALLTAIEDGLSFPFRAKLLGKVVDVTGMQWPDDEFGLDLICEHNGTRQPIAARSIELVRPLPKGHLILAAYLEWTKGLGIRAGS